MSERPWPLLAENFLYQNELALGIHHHHAHGLPNHAYGFRFYPQAAEHGRLPMVQAYRLSLLTPATFTNLPQIATWDRRHKQHPDMAEQAQAFPERPENSRFRGRRQEA